MDKYFLDELKSLYQMLLGIISFIYYGKFQLDFILFMSRSLNSFISFNSSSLISTPVYITKEYDFDINS
ncbi:unnamed protein product [Rhizophagus irregularis]|nr:unnamed protein product [Rhizophagus irregularis]